MNRRGFLTGLIAAPAIVAASNIMPVRAIERYPTIIWTPGMPYRPGDTFTGLDGEKYLAVAVKQRGSGFDVFANKIAAGEFTFDSRLMNRRTIETINRTVWYRNDQGQLKTYTPPEF